LPDPKFTNANRSLFAFIPNNAEPRRIAQMHKGAQKHRLDPSKRLKNQGCSVLPHERSGSRKASPGGD
jgi:hypothetical protein